MTCSPLKAIKEFGQFVPIRFRVVNKSKDAVYIERVDELIGNRRQLATFRAITEIPVRHDGNAIVLDASRARKTKFLEAHAFLPVNGSMTFTRTIRALGKLQALVIMAVPVKQRQILGTAYLPDPGNPRRWLLASPALYDGYQAGDRPVLFPPATALLPMGAARIETPLDAPDFPFPERFDASDPWTWSQALGGYVVLRSQSDLEIYLRNDVEPLPLAPFEFFDDLDKSTKGVPVIGPERKIITVTKKGARKFLFGLVGHEKDLTYSDNPEKAPYQIVER